MIVCCVGRGNAVSCSYGWRFYDGNSVFAVACHALLEKSTWEVGEAGKVCWSSDAYASSVLCCCLFFKCLVIFITIAVYMLMSLDSTCASLSLSHAAGPLAVRIVSASFPGRRSFRRTKPGYSCFVSYHSFCCVFTVYVAYCFLVFGCQYQCSQLPGRLISLMTCYVSSGTLNHTHPLTHSDATVPMLLQLYLKPAVYSCFSTSCFLVFFWSPFSLWCPLRCLLSKFSLLNMCPSFILFFVALSV